MPTTRKSAKTGKVIEATTISQSIKAKGDAQDAADIATVNEILAKRDPTRPRRTLNDLRALNGSLEVA